MTDVITGVLTIVGSTFALLGGIGALRFSDTLSRMHAATKATALGFMLIVLGVVVSLEPNDVGYLKLALAVGLVFLTAPVAAHLVGRASYRSGGSAVRLAGVDELASAYAAEEAAEEGAGEGDVEADARGPDDGGAP